MDRLGRTLGLFALAFSIGAGCGADDDDEGSGAGSSGKGGSASGGSAGRAGSAGSSGTASGGKAAGGAPAGGASSGGGGKSSNGGSAGNAAGQSAGGEGGGAIAGAAGVGEGGAAGSGLGGMEAGAGAANDDLGPVQCRTTDDCPGEPTAGGCFANKPGGVCTQCGVRGACPEGTECIDDAVDTTVCARPCELDGDCNRGMFCNTSNYCQQRTCAGNADPCPAPYTCNGDPGVCVRPSCQGAALVPSPCCAEPETSASSRSPGRPRW